MMQPRSKKGPSWKDVDDTPAPTAKDASSSKSKALAPPTPDDAESADPPPTDDAASDMDWLKRHMKSSLEIADPTAEKKFSQSDDEMDTTPDVRVHLC